MKNFELNKYNVERLKRGMEPLSLKKTTYKKPVIKDGYLVDENGNRVGTKGDMYTKKIMDDILTRGSLDFNPRPHYEDFYGGATYSVTDKCIKFKDGKEIKTYKNQDIFIKQNGVRVLTPAHTISVNNGIECSYDLSKNETPMITLRPIATKASCAEILWIYQRQSNDLVLFDEMLGKSTWDSNGRINNWWKDWALKDDFGNYKLNDLGHPTIGKCYGGSTGPRNMLRKEVIDEIKKNPDSRRLITCLWQIDDFNEEHGLKPCAFLTVWNVRHDFDGKNYLDMTMVQRSSDFATAGCINQVQYAALLMMVAKIIQSEN